MTDLAPVIDRILATKASGFRRLAAVAGPPASGKSTLAEQLVSDLSAAGEAAQLVPMDGFHLDDNLLRERGLLERKGAPNTFDVHGFRALVTRLKTDEPVVYPQFDRAREIAIAGVGYVPPECKTVVVEGNYLLLDAPVWRDLVLHWDVTIFLSVAQDVLERRLLARWAGFGYSPDEARTKAHGNDLPNGELVLERSLPATITL